MDFVDTFELLLYTGGVSCKGTVSVKGHNLSSSDTMVKVECLNSK